MHFSKTASFSSNSKYFACISTEDKLLVWETLNSVFIDCNFNASNNNNCTCIKWFHTHRKYASPKKAKILSNSTSENCLLAVGTLKGDLLLYNVADKNLYMHLRSRHSDAVNDISYYSETDSLFTCSSDKSIAIWDFSSGKEKSKWEAGDSPVYSICVIDENNLLSASSSILWWNVAEKTIIKKFDGHSNEIFKLLPVNSIALNSSYFLSAAVNDRKINAWSSNKSEHKTPVVSFILPGQPQDVDISRDFSKDKPLILSAVTKNGYLHFFEHVLNGTINQPIMPKVSIPITSEISNSSIISTRLSPDSESCIVAYGTNLSNMTFKHIKIKEVLEKSGKKNSDKDNCLDQSLTRNERSKNAKGLLVNGVKSATNPENSPKLTDSTASNYKRKLRSSRSLSSELEELNIGKMEDAKSKNKKKLDRIEEKELSPTEILLKAFQTGDDDVIDSVFCNSDVDFIHPAVKNFPVSNLKELLLKLKVRLDGQTGRRYPHCTLNKWLKEVSGVHLRYLAECTDPELIEIRRNMTKGIDSEEVYATIRKTIVARGLLKFHLSLLQGSSDESDSENEERMES